MPLYVLTGSPSNFHIFPLCADSYYHPSHCRGGISINGAEAFLAAVESHLGKLMQNNYTYQCIASSAVLSGWVKDCCRAEGSRTSCAPAPRRWIYGLPMPSAGMGFACAVSSETLQLLSAISRCCSSPCLCRWCSPNPPFLDDFSSFAKQMLPAAKHL